MQRGTSLLGPKAPFSGLFVSRWFGAPPDFSLSTLRGRVIALHTFQMLCPGCVSHGIPQAQRLERVFEGAPLTVVGLHTVFEHHEAMTPTSLEAFLLEYRITHPVGVDAPSDGIPVPQTMSRLRLRGTPSLLLLDAEGNLRASHFGRRDDLLVGAQIGALLSEAEASPTAESCTPDGCVIRT